jgi:uncharacterized protein YbcC (UPF0753/DUF2309 family)
MKSSQTVFDVIEAINFIKHFLPTQAALKDFIHHNTLHAFQDQHFHDACRQASLWFGAKTYLSFDEYRKLYAEDKISSFTLKKVLEKRQSKDRDLFHELFNFQDTEEVKPSFFSVRESVEQYYGINLRKFVQPRLYRILASFLDQGIHLENIFPQNLCFLDGLIFLETHAKSSLFENKEVVDLLKSKTSIDILLQKVVGCKQHFTQYLFEQQMTHPGWSGFVAVVESNPRTLIEPKKISLQEMIQFELMLEIDAILSVKGNNWKSPDCHCFPAETGFLKDQQGLKWQLLAIWQEALEWTYFDKILSNIPKTAPDHESHKKDFQALFCIDDRCVSLRKHLAAVHPNSESFGTPGFFGVEFYYQPQGAKQYTKSCPAPVTPEYLIQEQGEVVAHQRDAHFSNRAYTPILGMISSMTLGFLSIVKLAVGTFKPSDHAFASKSTKHVHPNSDLTIDFQGLSSDGLKIGFTIEEMTTRVYKVLKSIGLTENFADLVYVIGHGASSVNNPYYAGYDCGACSGRPGSVNARVFAAMANKPEVRLALKNLGINIPKETFFLAALHDTTCDEITYYDKDLPENKRSQHALYKTYFSEALLRNAAERASRFDLIDVDLGAHKKHQLLIEKSKSLFEPRPEWNHTDNALCIIGLPHFFKQFDLDKRAFLNSYDYRKDPDGSSLKMILSAAIPVCGGINLEYYFSRTDQQRFGAGTKLPHNVLGLFAVTNGVEDDIRPGLPSQMIEIHTPTRLLFIIEQDPQLILKILEENPKLMEWVKNQWVLFSAVHPKTREVYIFEHGRFEAYQSIDVEHSNAIAL